MRYNITGRHVEVTEGIGSQSKTGSPKGNADYRGNHTY